MPPLGRSTPTPDELIRLQAALSAHYVVERELGRGGMATVYLARDLRHDRRVAVKVLRPELAAVIGAERFLREVHVTAHLQHPHILPLFDSGEVGSFLYYVMPYVEGESLRDRLKRERQLPVEDAVRIASEVAAALEYAHDHGVIHRDIKPENILLAGGSAVVADFGIARAVTAAGAGRLTETGLSLGTPQYMSPEQATADRELDGRSDLYSLACVLYEMLAGEPPHAGPTTQSVIARVLTDEPRPLETLRSTVPLHVARATHKALAKLAADRFASAAQFSEALHRTTDSEAGERTGSRTGLQAAATGDRTRWLQRNRTTALLAAGLVLTSGLAVWSLVRGRAPGPAPAVERFALRLPATAAMGGGPGATIAVSPDGTQIVYVASTDSGGHLYVRRMDALEPTAIPGTTLAFQPYFSFDGAWLAFFQGTTLARRSIAGGPVLKVCDVPSLAAEGASWGPDDTIVFALSGSLFAVPATGGTPRLLASPDSTRNELFAWPAFLPDGRAVLFTDRIGVRDQLAVLTLGTGTVKRLDVPGSNPHYVASGFVMLANQDGTIVAVPFDARRQVVTGSAIPIAGDVSVGGEGAAKLGVSADGTIVYETQNSSGRLTLVNRQGVARDLGGPPGRYFGPRFSPDGRKILVSVANGSASDIWLYDIAGRTPTRLTFSSDARAAIWTPDGHHIIYARAHTGIGDLVRSSDMSLWTMPVDGSAPPDSLLWTHGAKWPGDVAPDGRTLFFSSYADMLSIETLRLDSAGPPHPLFSSASPIFDPSLSPDGRWLAYVALSGVGPQVYVRPSSGPGGPWQVSLNSGLEPRWSRTGHEIFFRAGFGTGSRMMAAEVRTSPGFTVGDRLELFQAEYQAAGPVFPEFDASSDGQSFVMIKPDAAASNVVVLLNWFAQLQARQSLRAKRTSG